MAKKSPEEIAALRAQYADKTAEKEAKRAAKKAKFGDQNAEQNMPTVEHVIPWTTSWRNPDGTFCTKEIDVEKPPWNDWSECAERLYRQAIFVRTGKWPEYPIKVKLVRTSSLQEDAYRRLYGRDIVFIDRTKR